MPQPLLSQQNHHITLQNYTVTYRFDTSLVLHCNQPYPYSSTHHSANTMQPVAFPLLHLTRPFCALPEHHLSKHHRHIAELNYTIALPSVTMPGLIKAKQCLNYTKPYRCSTIHCFSLPSPRITLPCLNASLQYYARASLY